MRRARCLFSMPEVFGEPFQHLLLQQEFIHDESGNLGEAEARGTHSLAGQPAEDSIREFVSSAGFMRTSAGWLAAAYFE